MRLNLILLMVLFAAVIISCNKHKATETVDNQKTVTATRLQTQDSPEQVVHAVTEGTVPDDAVPYHFGGASRACASNTHSCTSKDCCEGCKFVNGDDGCIIGCTCSYASHAEDCAGANLSCSHTVTTNGGGGIATGPDELFYTDRNGDYMVLGIADVLKLLTVNYYEMNPKRPKGNMTALTVETNREGNNPHAVGRGTDADGYAIAIAKPLSR